MSVCLSRCRCPCRCVRVCAGVRVAGVHAGIHVHVHAGVHVRAGVSVPVCPWRCHCVRAGVPVSVPVSVAVSIPVSGMDTVEGLKSTSSILMWALYRRKLEDLALKSNRLNALKKDFYRISHLWPLLLLLNHQCDSGLQKSQLLESGQSTGPVDVWDIEKDLCQEVEAHGVLGR
ncbi:unnamed protein product [Leuciscus chuanchicus]